jgi:hypothetical protein
MRLRRICISAEQGLRTLLHKITVLLGEAPLPSQQAAASTGKDSTPATGGAEQAPPAAGGPGAQGAAAMRVGSAASSSLGSARELQRGGAASGGRAQQRPGVNVAGSHKAARCGWGCCGNYLGVVESLDARASECVGVGHVDSHAGAHARPACAKSSMLVQGKCPMLWPCLQ